MSLDRNRAAKRAREARSALGLDPRAPLDCLLTVVEQRAGLPVVIWEMPPEVAGAWWGRDGRYVLHVNGAHAHVRQRFTLAHELGHAWCRHDGASKADAITTIEGKTTNPGEIQANAFAAEFLLPKAAVYGLCVERPLTLEDVVGVAATFGVSALVALFRLMETGHVGATRGAKLRQEIDDRLHLHLRRHLGLDAVDDRLARIARADLPYLSPMLACSKLAQQLAAARRQPV